MTKFSDYIVYVDESGDHSLTSIDRHFPVFALSFCVFEKAEYARAVVPSMQNLKFKYWGHDAVVLHENEIRKSKGEFAWLLTSREKRENFYSDLTSLISTAPFELIASVIHKEKLTNRYAKPWNPYEIALQFCLERLLKFVLEKDDRDKKIHVIFECRGKKEDQELELAFRRIVAGDGSLPNRICDFSQAYFEPIFLKKSVNSSGLQLADLTARPIGLKALKPKQPNRTYEIIENKLYAQKVFP